ncbi:MAG: DCC1-like thiol-disulfide oxidoreductase family protein [Flavobacteriales bacterium]
MPDKLILFDGVCNLCNGVVQFVIKRDPESKFRFGTLQGKTADQVLGSKSIDTVVYVRNGIQLTKSTAALWIARDLGGVWTMTAVFFILPRFLRDWCYNLVAKIRYSVFGKRDECMVPTAELQSRFVD